MDFVFASSPYLKKFVEFYCEKTISAKIYILINLYSVKIYSCKVKDLSNLLKVSYIDISGSVHFISEMYRHLLVKVNLEEIFQFLRVQFNVLMTFKEFCNVYFTKLLENHRIPTNIDIHEKTIWTENSEQMEQV